MAVTRNALSTTVPVSFRKLRAGARDPRPIIRGVGVGIDRLGLVLVVTVLLLRVTTRG
jgi:hypothetical protein